MSAESIERRRLISRARIDRCCMACGQPLSAAAIVPSRETGGDGDDDPVLCDECLKRAAREEARAVRVRPIPGVQSLEYRKGNRRLQRCSCCQRERDLSPSLVLHVERRDAAFDAIMVGNDLVGIVCPDCVHDVEVHIQGIFPERHAFPFIDPMGQLIPTPRCECGIPLVYTDDGRGMACCQCDVAKRD